MKSLFLVVALVLMPPTVKVNSAQEPLGLSTFPAAYDYARAVFLGEVVKVEPVTDITGPWGTRLDRVTLKVEYSWKGAGFQEIGLHELVVLSEQPSPHAWGSWGAFREGGQYLVYANETWDKKLIVRSAGRTMPVWKAADELKRLRKLNDPLSPHVRAFSF